jgi:hypothetical protein
MKFTIPFIAALSPLLPAATWDPPPEAWKTAEGIYRTTYETGGLWFRTPECWAEKDGKIGYRASMYMRPLAVWAIQAALESRPAGS